MQWDLFCRVVDNFGDIGVCWRLAADLTARGETVRLWVDDASALAWMAPGGAPGVAVMPWQQAQAGVAPGDVVIEAFGCDPPRAFVAAMAQRRDAPVWINLEYLSAEAAVESLHRLPSPQQQGPGTGLVKRFFYPGFTLRTGGLLREPRMLAQRGAFVPAKWLQSHGATPTAGETVVSLFCYANPALPALLHSLAERPTLLLAAAGTAADQVSAVLGPTLRRGMLRARLMPLMSQADYDRLLWACDLNFVRGEDSFVRAQWAARPFVWQIYPQADGVHRTKLEAFLDRFLGNANPDLAVAVRAAALAWNEFALWPRALPPLPQWQAHCEAWRAGLLGQADLTCQLIALVAESR